MTMPRRLLPESTYLITRRCSQRQFLLAPSDWLERLFLYCLAVAAERTKIVIHAIIVMSNHYHIVASDPHATVPEFCNHLNQMVARAANARYGRWDYFWDSSAPSYVRLLTADDIVAKIVYAMVNPVKAGLVEYGHKWPGIRIFTPGRRRIARPDWFFRSDGEMPKTVDLHIVAPPIGMPQHQAQRTIAEAIDAEEDRIRASFRAEGRTFVGTARVRSQRFDESPRTVEPRRQLSPTVACRDKWKRIEVLQRCKEFIADYRDALRRWMTRARDVVFPVGTYAMARRHNVHVAPA